jgi:hypothetical protein
MSQMNLFGQPLRQPPELNRLNHIEPPTGAPNTEGRDQGIDRALSAESDTMRQAALDLLRDLCHQQELLTTDDWHQAAHDAGLLIRPKAVGGLWQKARSLGWCVDTGQVVLTRRPRAHGRKIPVMRSCLWRPSA